MNKDLKSDNLYTKKYISELSKKYPTINSALAEIIKLSAILELPKGTEHFISDIHGEAEALSHIMRNASGVIKRKLNGLFGSELPAQRIAELATLIYYPEEKLAELNRCKKGTEYFADTLERMVMLCRLAAAKYTRAKVRGRIEKSSGDYAEIICELINSEDSPGKEEYYKSIYCSLLSPKVLYSFIPALASAIKSLVVDRLHVVGDIFDRGARADLVMDELMRMDSIDFQWGNHDALWMGAAAGSDACCAGAVFNSLAYGNLDVLEIGYGISLRPLAEFTQKYYPTEKSDCIAMQYNFSGKNRNPIISAMQKAIAIMEFKLEGQLIERNPSYHMDERRMLHKIDTENRKISIDGANYELNFSKFPTLDKSQPYELCEDEKYVISYLKHAFMHSERLRRHVEFLFKHGSTYKIANGNLLFHGSIPLEENGKLLHLDAAGGLCGRALMEHSDKMARLGYFAKEGSKERISGRDYLWFLWCGKNSPLSGREKTTTFERLFINDKSTHKELKNSYFDCWQDKSLAEMILKEFGLVGERSHIINGHIPVKKGENPVKGGGKLIVIDGGFCSAYHKKTGIGGYTLIYNADGMRISAHEPFAGKDEAIKRNADIVSENAVFEKSEEKIKTKETDDGARILERIGDLYALIDDYESRAIIETSLDR